MISAVVCIHSRALKVVYVENKIAYASLEEKRTYGYEFRVTLHHCNMILYTVRKCNN